MSYKHVEGKAFDRVFNVHVGDDEFKTLNILNLTNLWKNTDFSIIESSNNEGFNR